MNVRDKIFWLQSATIRLLSDTTIDNRMKFRNTEVFGVFLRGFWSIVSPNEVSPTDNIAICWGAD